jgi:undecaprenyl diphosphate synthase
MGLLERYLKKAIREMAQKNIRLTFFGDLAPLSDSLKRLIEETREISRHTTGMQVNVCLNYGGRDEIVRAARKLAQDCAEGRLDPADISEEMLGKSLYSAGVPDPDLMIRPGGELRLSNFLLWQNAYTEFYFTDTLWPDMDEVELDRAIAAYQGRKRRYGGI